MVVCILYALLHLDNKPDIAFVPYEQFIGAANWLSDGVSPKSSAAFTNLTITTGGLCHLSFMNKFSSRRAYYSSLSHGVVS